MNKLFLVLVGVWLVGCGVRTDKREIVDTKDSDNRIVEAVKDVSAKQEAKFDTLTTAIRKAEDAVSSAVAAGDRVKELEAERDLYRAQAARATAIADEQALLATSFEAKADGLEKGIYQAKLDEAESKLYWFAGIMGFATIVSIAICIAFPLTRAYAIYFPIVFASLAGVSIAAAQLLPYLRIIGIGIGVVGVAGILIAWARRDRGLKQLTQAIEPLKDKIDDYKTHFRQYIDSDVDKLLDKIREK